MGKKRVKNEGGVGEGAREERKGRWRGRIKGRGRK